MKKLLDSNRYIVGVLWTLGSEIVIGTLVWVVLLATGWDVVTHIRWFSLAFVPPLLLLRYYAHQKEYPLTLRAVIVTFFVTFVAFMWVMLKNHYIAFN